VIYQNYSGVPEFHTFTQHFLLANICSLSLETNIQMDTALFVYRELFYSQPVVTQLMLFIRQSLNLVFVVCLIIEIATAQVHREAQPPFLLSFIELKHS
jgi:hypothetical protein